MKTHQKAAQLWLQIEKQSGIRPTAYLVVKASNVSERLLDSFTKAVVRETGLDLGRSPFDPGMVVDRLETAQDASIGRRRRKAPGALGGHFPDR